MWNGQISARVHFLLQPYTRVYLQKDLFQKVLYLWNDCSLSLRCILGTSLNGISKAHIRQVLVTICSIFVTDVGLTDKIKYPYKQRKSLEILIKENLRSKQYFIDKSKFRMSRSIYLGFCFGWFQIEFSLCSIYHSHI